MVAANVVVVVVADPRFAYRGVKTIQSKAVLRLNCNKVFHGMKTNSSQMCALQEQSLHLAVAQCCRRPFKTPAEGYVSCDHLGGWCGDIKGLINIHSQKQ